MGDADPHRTPRAGTLLVASPRMLDPNFMHAVVLVCDHGPQGTFGLVVNRPLPLRVADLDADVPLLSGRSDRLWSGGPVQRDALQVVHRVAGEVPGAMRIADGIAFGGDPDVLRAAIDGVGAEGVRFVLGYSGWGAGQLDAEMGEDAWVVVPATARRVFDPAPETLWRRVLRAEGGEIAGLADVPPDPSWN
jgi:putative transcriptional regulator